MLRRLIAVLVLSAVASAQSAGPQPVAFTGVVQPVLDPGAAGLICAPPNYQLACADGTFYLTSSSLDLSALIGVNAKLTATQVPDCPLYDVSDAQVPPPATLVQCGTGAGLGCPIRLRSGPGGLSTHALFLSLTPGLVPLNLTKGSFLLGEPFVFVALVTGGFPPEGAAFDFGIPSDPAIIGQRFYWQTASRSVGPVGPWHLSNAVCFTPISSTIPCVLPDC